MVSFSWLGFVGLYYIMAFNIITVVLSYLECLKTRNFWLIKDICPALYTSRGYFLKEDKTEKLVLTEINNSKLLYFVQ